MIENEYTPTKRERTKIIPNKINTIRGEKKKRINIGMTRIQAFHKPNSKAGINDNYFPPETQFYYKQ